MSEVMKSARVGSPDDGSGIRIPERLIGVLKLDTLIVLGWLVSRKDDYEGSVSENAISNVFGIGNNKAARIIDELERGGYSKTVKIMTDDGYQWFRFVSFSPVFNNTSADALMEVMQCQRTQ